MDLQRLRYLKASVQAVKLNLESLILSSSGGVYSTSRNKILKRNYSHGNNQHLTRFKYNNGKDFLVRDWKFQHNSVQKRRKNTSASRIYTDAIENEKLQGFRSCMNNECFTSNELGSITVDRRQFLTIHKSILLVRHYSSLSPKVERWRAKDKKDRRKLAKIVECVPGKSSDGGGGFFKNIFGKLFGGKSNADLKCNCRKQRSSSKLTENKQEKKVEEDVDPCDVDSNVEKANKNEKSLSKTKDDCDDKSNKQIESKNVCIKTCASNACTSLERADKSYEKSSKPTTDSSTICQTSNRIKPSNSCGSGGLSDRLKQLQTLEKCIGTLQQLIKNLKLEEEMKRACSKPVKVVCGSSSKKPACPEPKMKPICPEPEKPTCPEPEKPACPVEKPICPVPVKPLCPEPFKKPACPQPRKPVCPEPKKPVCPEPKKPACPEPKKPVCPEPEKKSSCPETEEPICPKAENSNKECDEEPAYKCGIIEDPCPPKRQHRKQSLRDKNDKYSSACGKEIHKQEDQCSQKVKNCTDDDESKNNC
ncbi:hypothetical protein LSTR_LSTR008896 [Laodelphax striatellus]|uniref:Uncharacterized protein n=1 Tax=Laodelphax striatellus TaxID=195883 RepID=A0A482WLD3_LAOST|nr:hypothetical protein LSTR_LSTR008896 [Laodelphax striatellus]